MTRAQFDDLRRRVEHEAPNRARGVLTLIASVEMPVAQNRRTRRNAERLKRQGHPARTTANQRRKQWHDPSPRQRRIRELNRLMRDEAERAGDEYSEITGPIGVVATYAAPILLADAGLNVEEHRYPFQHWLKAKLEDVVRTLDGDGCDISGYLSWREGTLERMPDAVHH